MSRLTQVARGVLRPAAAACAALVVGGTAQAVDFNWSGFGNVNIGRTFNAKGLSDDDWGYPQTVRWGHCPCYIADYSHAGVYESRWSALPESRLGVQGTVNVNDDLSATAQAVLRNQATDTKVVLEQAYLSYNLSNKFTLQAGRKRLPLFYYSDFQDVSFAYNWTRVPPDVYGWAVVNFNGANLTYRDSLGDWAVKSSIYAGSERDKDNLLNKLGNQDRQLIEWRNIRGLDLELTRDWFAVRFSLSKSDQRRERHRASGEVTQQPDPTTDGMRFSPQTYTSLAFNVDKDDFVARAELLRVERKPVLGNYKGYLAAVGYRIGKFLPLITTSELKAYSADGFSNLEETDSTLAATLRYQLSDTSSLKAQVERSRWKLPDGTFRDRSLITFGYDFVF